MACGSAFRRLSAIAVAATALACSSDPDVVVEDTNTGMGGFIGSPTQSCQVGVYEGTFNGALGSVENPVQFKGDIRFTLEPTENREFADIRNTQLEAEAESLPITIVAHVEGKGACREGNFDAEFSGTYTIGEGTAGGTFTGPINGDYYPEHSAFIGQWTAKDGEQLLGTGTWIAAWIQELD